MVPVLPYLTFPARLSSDLVLDPPDAGQLVLQGQRTVQRRNLRRPARTTGRTRGLVPGTDRARRPPGIRGKDASPRALPERHRVLRRLWLTPDPVPRQEPQRSHLSLLHLRRPTLQAHQL